MFPFMIISKKYTTYEFIIKVMRRGKESSDKEIYFKEVSRHDIRFIQSFIQIIGDNPLLWLITIYLSGNS